jgi:hypothetical protein
MYDPTSLTDEVQPAPNLSGAVKVALVCILILLGLYWLGAYMKDSKQSVAGTVVKATPAPEVKHIPLVPVETKKPVKVFAGGTAVKNKLQLPREVIEAPEEEVIASTKIDNRDRHPHTVTTTLNTETGETETYVRTDPLPWLATSTRGHVGMYAGLKNGEQTIRLQAEQELFSVKSVHFGAIATIDQPMGGPSGTDYFVGFGAKYEW